MAAMGAMGAMGATKTTEDLHMNETNSKRTGQKIGNVKIKL
jgi:hypothetical protein